MQYSNSSVQYFCRPCLGAQCAALRLRGGAASAGVDFLLTDIGMARDSRKHVGQDRERARCVEQSTLNIFLWAVAVAGVMGVASAQSTREVVLTTEETPPGAFSTIGNTTMVPTTTPTPVLCPSPPCPPRQNVFLQPQSGPNRNNQQMGQVVTVSGVFFPEDCSKGCVFSPPCETCEMEVTYSIYFGTEDAGCNFEDSAAAACQCTPLSGQVGFSPVSHMIKPWRKGDTSMHALRSVCMHSSCLSVLTVNNAACRTSRATATGRVLRLLPNIDAAASRARYNAPFTLTASWPKLLPNRSASLLI